MATGLFLLVVLTAVMALASFLAGALPLSMSLSQSQLRLISSIGVGILVGTSLIVIIPEGIEAVVEASSPAHSHNTRSLHNTRHPTGVRWLEDTEVHAQSELDWQDFMRRRDVPTTKGQLTYSPLASREEGPETPKENEETPVSETPQDEDGVPTFHIGLSMVLGFILMFLIDHMPRHASENFHPPPPPRHISLSNLGGSSLSADEEETDGFLGSLAPTPKQSRSLATTTGLVIHAAADGIAMGASATSSDTQLGFIIFIAIMVHKAPAAFGLTSILLKQGLSKRAARGHLIVFSLAAPVGAWLTYVLVSFLGGGGDSQLNKWWTGMLLLFSAGTFLYVAMHAMQEGDSPSGHDGGSGANGYADSGPGAHRKHSHPQLRETLATAIGMLLPLLTQFGHHH